MFLISRSHHRGASQSQHWLWLAPLWLPPMRKSRHRPPISWSLYYLPLVVLFQDCSCSFDQCFHVLHLVQPCQLGADLPQLRQSLLQFSLTEMQTTSSRTQKILRYDFKWIFKLCTYAVGEKISCYVVVILCTIKAKKAEEITKNLFETLLSVLHACFMYCGVQ